MGDSWPQIPSEVERRPPTLRCDAQCLCPALEAVWKRSSLPSGIVNCPTIRWWWSPTNRLHRDWSARALPDRGPRPRSGRAAVRSAAVFWGPKKCPLLQQRAYRPLPRCRQKGARERRTSHRTIAWAIFTHAKCARLPRPPRSTRLPRPDGVRSREGLCGVRR